MPSYSIRILPVNSNKISQEQIDEIAKIITGKVIATPAVIFEQSAKQPREGFDSSSVDVTEYGIKANYILEEELIVPTMDGDTKYFQKTIIESKLICKEGILLITSTSDKVDTVSKKWADIMFPTKIISCKNLEITREQLQQIIKDYAKTVIGISHIECKGLDKIRMVAYDLPNKEWYKKEGFDSDQVEQITFIPNPPPNLIKTPICRIYRNGKLVIYHNAKFSEDEFERIELYLIDILSQVLGSPLCKHGIMASQGKLLL